MDYTYSYTDNGDLSLKVSKLTGNKIEYAWGSFGELTEVVVKKSNNTIKSQIINKYDSFGRRIQKNDVRFVYDGESIIAEFGADNSVKALYLHGAGIDEPLAMVRDVDGDGEFTEKEVFFFSKDHLNSVHDLTDSQGKPVQRYNYTAYGKTKIEKTNLNRDAKLVQNPFAYTSREWEQESGDYYYRARYYDPGAGRFLSEDPIHFNGGDFNLYRYVSNNPIKYVDPFGHEAVLVLIGFSDCVTTSLNNAFYFSQPGKQIPIKIFDPDTGGISTGQGCIMACSGVIGIGSCRKIDPPKNKCENNI